MQANKSRVFALALPIALSLLLLACAGEPESAPDPFNYKDGSLSEPDPREPAGIISATDLFEEYNRDRAAADKKYKEKAYVITGRVGKFQLSWNALNVTLLSEETLPDWLEGADLPLRRGDNRFHRPLPGVKLAVIERGHLLDLSIDFENVGTVIIKGRIEGASPRGKGSMIPLLIEEEESGTQDEISARKPLNVYVADCVVIDMSYGDPRKPLHF